MLYVQQSLPIKKLRYAIEILRYATAVLAALWFAITGAFLTDALAGVSKILLINQNSAAIGGAPPAANHVVAPTGVPADIQSVGGSNSFNWAGYATLGTFTGVSGSWNMPAISDTSGISSDATWIGIGGITNNDLIQAGTQAMIEDGGLIYRAWYELLPGAMMYAPLVVHAGDTISASLTQESPGLWQIVITNETTGKTYQTIVDYSSSLSSAEWIEERPSLATGGLLPLDSFGSINWHNTSVIENGQRLSAQAAGAQPINMLSRGGTMLAQPSPLTDSGSFSIARVNTPAPAEMVAQQASAASHGVYYLYVDGKLLEQKQW